MRQMTEELNNAYEKFVMLTGPTPDAYRSYGFNRLVPDAVNILGKSAKRHEHAPLPLRLRLCGCGVHQHIVFALYD